MKQFQLIRTATCAITTLMVLATRAQTSMHENPHSVTIVASTATFILPQSAQQAALSKQEADGLLFMREEEKLAQNVYRALADKWGSRPFGNIMQAEVAHTGWVKDLLAKYGVAYPGADFPAGKFKDKTLQKLYDTLIKQGSVSRVEALKVGATIEDVDLFDLDRWSKLNKRPDIQHVYDNLARGSRNHLRAFVRNLSNSGVTYKPKYITKKVFDDIIASDWERGGR